MAGNEAFLIIGALALFAGVVLLFASARDARAERVARTQPHPTPIAAPIQGDRPRLALNVAVWHSGGVRNRVGSPGNF